MRKDAKGKKKRSRRDKALSKHCPKYHNKRYIHVCAHTQGQTSKCLSAAIWTDIRKKPK